MQLTPKVKEILSWYEGESPGVKGSLVIKIYLNEA
jgi:hypothetical protein